MQTKNHQISSSKGMLRRTLISNTAVIYTIPYFCQLLLFV